MTSTTEFASCLVPFDPVPRAGFSAARRITAISLPSDYRALSIAERLQLVEDVWHSIATEQPDATALPITAAERAELDRRLGSQALFLGLSPSDATTRAAVRLTN